MGVSPPAWGESENPILTLYRERVAFARVEKEKAELVQGYLKELEQTYEDLYSQGAISEASVREAVRRSVLSQSTVGQMQNQIEQAEALFQLASIRLRARQDMPFCFAP